MAGNSDGCLIVILFGCFVQLKKKSNPKQPSCKIVRNSQECCCDVKFNVVAKKWP